MSTTENSSETLPPKVAQDKDSEQATSMLEKPVSILTPEDEEVEGEEKEEGADDEENLFANLEKEQETRLLSSPSLVPQPKEVHAAPKLLQKALEDGQVQASDSEQESEGEKIASSKARSEEKKDGASEGAHVHQRVSLCRDGTTFCWRDV